MGSGSVAGGKSNLTKTGRVTLFSVFSLAVSRPKYDADLISSEKDSPARRAFDRRRPPPSLTRDIDFVLVSRL